jgi:hypothetical protein
MLAISEGPNRVGNSFPAPEDDKDLVSETMFSIYLLVEFRTMVKALKPSVSECYTVAWEPFRFYSPI